MLTNKVPLTYIYIDKAGSRCMKREGDFIFSDVEEMKNTVRQIQELVKK